MSEPDPAYAARAAHADQMLGHVRTTRTCANCDLCCTAVGVEEIGKLPAVRCPLLVGPPGRSCGVYENRPHACREFLCLWRGSDTCLPDNLQPAKVGFVVALTNDFRSFPLLFTVHPDPAHPDAWKAPRHRLVFKTLARDFNAMVVVGQHHLARHVFAPSGSEYNRAQHPQFFEEDGGRIGVPEHDFFEWRLSLEEVCAKLWGL
jgi:uncharacterized protein